MKYGNQQSRFGPFTDYKFIDFFNEAFNCFVMEKNLSNGGQMDKQTTEYIMESMHSKIHRDYYSGSIKQFNLAQIDRRPNLDLTEAKWDLFKITLSDNGTQSTLSQCETTLFLIEYLLITFSQCGTDECLVA